MPYDSPDASLACLAAVRERNPLVHCVTNYVTANDCANALLAIGASPVMADDEGEVEDIVSLADALVLNIGTLSARTVASMLKAGAKANERGIPVVFDPVGVGASALRTASALRISREVRLSVIRGNVSEIESLAFGGAGARGVDAARDALSGDSLKRAIAAARALSRSTGAIVAVTGKIDAVCLAGRESSGDRIASVRNGHELMARITGSGCVLSALIGGFCGASPQAPFEATVACVSAMGLAGEMAAVASRSLGTGGFRASLIDALSRLDGESLAGGMRVEDVAP